MSTKTMNAGTVDPVDVDHQGWKSADEPGTARDVFSPDATEFAMGDADNRPIGNLRKGSAVEVRGRFEQAWHDGYEVESVSKQGIELRRLSDQSVLPTFFDPQDVRKHRRRSTWWT